MTVRRFSLIVLSLLSLTASAGHALINSFAGIRWLPPAGTTEADWTYPAKRLLEEAQLDLTPRPEAARALLETFARRRLAEMEVLVRAGNAAALALTCQRYERHLDALEQRIAMSLGGAPEARWLAYANALLEQQYIISTDYLDLPREQRTSLAEAIRIASKHYAIARARLSTPTQESLFFREEEIRWSWDQALGADAQGL